MKIYNLALDLIQSARKAGKGWQRYTLQAEARSLYLVSGEARSAWEHGIAPVETPRWSVTLRTMA